MSASGFHNLADCSANHIHFFGCEPVPARKITSLARWPNVALYVRQIIINAVQPSRAFNRAAINARIDNQFVNLGGRKVACVNSFICLAEEDRATFVATAIPALPLANLGALFWGLVGPPISSVVATLLAGAVALTALIRNSTSSAFVRAKELGCSGLFSLTSVTFSHVGTISLPHTEWKEYP